MFNFKKPDIAIEAQKGKIHTIGAEIGIFVLVFFIGQIIASVVPAINTCIKMFSGGAIFDLFSDFTEGNISFTELVAGLTTTTDVDFIIILFSTVFATLTAIIYCTKIEKRSIYSMGLGKKKGLSSYGIGLVFGFVLFSLCVLIPVAMKQMEFTKFNKDANLIIVLFFALGYGLQGFSEEVIFRGYFFVTLMKKYSILVAVIVNSLAFALAHISNSGLTIVAFVNLTLVGVLMSLYVTKTNNMWGAAAFHSIWNFSQGIIYGIAVSGTNAKTSIFKVSGTGNSLITGGAFGIEGSVVTLVLLLVACGFFMYRLNASEKAEQPDELEKAE